MNGFVRIAAVWMLGGAALAQPVPPPPDGFQGQQYIDGQGCVFGRQQNAWVARLDGQGQRVCGFPPSLDARRTDAGAERILPLTPEPSPDAASLLLEQLSRDLRPGEWTSDPRPAEERAEPRPSRLPDPVQTAIQDALQVAPAIRQAAGVTLTPETCARLGYRVDGTGPASATGLCAGMQAEPGLSGVAPIVPAVPVAAPAPRQPAPARQARTAAPAKAPARSTRAPSTGPARAAAPVAPPAQAAPREEMIPPSARYVQVGAYSDEGNAMAVLRALAARGYRTGQTRTTSGDRTMRVIMAGPFTDRQSLVAALNDLRRNGYPGAVAR